ncbi:hypothetical protein RhiirA5_446887, partial [Rhizophagus irregularis]
KRITEIKRERNERKEKESISDKERTNEELLEKWIDEYEHLEKISKIEHSIIKAVDKAVTKLWRDRSSDQYKYSFKEFEKNLEIENWGTTDTGNHIAKPRIQKRTKRKRKEQKGDNGQFIWTNNQQKNRSQYKKKRAILRRRYR